MLIKVVIVDNDNGLLKWLQQRLKMYKKKKKKNTRTYNKKLWASNKGVLNRQSLHTYIIGG